MKSSKLMMRLIMSTLLVGVLVYFGIYLAQSWKGGVTTVRAYTDRVNVGISATGVLVREETALENENAVGRVADLIPDEGEKVAAGAPVAILYSSVNGQETSQQIKQLEAEIKQLEFVLASSARPGDTARLDAQVCSAVAGLRSAAATGDLTGLEDGAFSLRTLVFKRDFTYGDFTADEISALIEEKNNRLEALRITLGAASTTVYAPVSGLFSAGADGFEFLSPVTLSWVSPSQLRTMLKQQQPVGEEVVGKVITASTWYFAAVVSEDKAEDLQEGKSYPVIFSRDWAGEVTMKLERMSDAEQGNVLLVFSSRTHLADTTRLREQTAEVVGRSLEGLRIPSSSLRAVTRTVTDQKTGEETEVQELGVYVLVGAAAEFKPVSILWQDEDSYLVAPVLTSTSDRAEAERLQEGDEIILNTSGLHDGKVVR